MLFFYCVNILATKITLLKWFFLLKVYTYSSLCSLPQLSYETLDIVFAILYIRCYKINFSHKMLNEFRNATHHFCVTLISFQTLQKYISVEKNIPTYTSFETRG